MKYVCLPTSFRSKEIVTESLQDKSCFLMDSWLFGCMGIILPSLLEGYHGIEYFYRIPPVSFDYLSTVPILEVLSVDIRKNNSIVLKDGRRGKVDKMVGREESIIGRVDKILLTYRIMMEQTLNREYTVELPYFIDDPSNLGDLEAVTVLLSNFGTTVPELVDIISDSLFIPDCSRDLEDQLVDFRSRLTRRLGKVFLSKEETALLELQERLKSIAMQIPHGSKIQVTFKPELEKSFTIVR